MISFDIIDHVREGFQIISNEWKYLYLNLKSIEHSRFRREDLIGKSMMEVYPGIENTDMFRRLEDSMRTGSTHIFENEFTYPDGFKDWFELHVLPVPDGLLIISINISERKKIESFKEKYTGELEELIHFMTHQIRHPITVIMSIESLSNNGKMTNEDLEIAIKVMKESIAKLDNLTRILMKRLNKIVVDG
ncbi:MAG: PAS domain-containing protein [Bacteroidetes bacterium]|nr:PAS domain-containing protein [Bacteroidota bacterium]